MSWIKDDRAMQLDRLLRQADETLTFYRDLGERLEDDSLRQALLQGVALQEDLLARLRQCRRRDGELPQAGDPERGHLQALLAEARGLFGPEEHDAAAVEALLRSTANLAAEVEAALAIADLTREEVAVLEAYRGVVGELERQLRRP